MSLREALVSAARKCNGKTPDEFGYFDHFYDNAWQWDENRDGKAFRAAGGNELKDENDRKAKARAAYSSSMFAYNFFSWVGENTPCKINGVEYNERFFEVRIPCLTVSRANMDVVLLSENREHVLFIESKLTEHLSRASSNMKSMRKSYDELDKYYSNGETWLDVVKRWRDKAVKNSPNPGYFDGIKQEICHRIAINNLRSRKVQILSRFEELNANAGGNLLVAIKNPATTFLFTSLVFEPKSERERCKFEDYKAIHNEFKESIHDLNNSSLETYSKLWNDECFKAYMPEKLKQYLKQRYMQFSA